MGLIGVAISGAQAAAKRLEQLGVDLREAERRAVEIAGTKMLSRSKHLASGEVIKVRTSALLNSLNKDAAFFDAPKGGYAIAVGSRRGPSEKYAPLHEFGGTVHRISSRGLAFDAVYRPRRFIGIAFDEIRPRVALIVQDEVNKAVAKAARG